MSQKIRFRKLREEEYEQAKKRFRAEWPDVPREPEWSNVWARFENGKITGMVECSVQVRHVVSMMCADNPAIAMTLIERADQIMADSQNGSQFDSYEFHVDPKNARFKRLLEKRYGLEGVKEPYLLYFVRR